jgi:hypothetical protein
MWLSKFEQRLQSWTQLREMAVRQDSETALMTINSWWFQTPWTAYHLHWDDRLDWPDPWQLLSDDIYCPLARGLGILYTITMLDHPDIQDAELIEVGGDNLVLVCKGKYTLNWSQEEIVNISPANKNKNSRRSLSQAVLKQQVN